MPDHAKTKTARGRSQEMTKAIRPRARRSQSVPNAFHREATTGCGSGYAGKRGEHGAARPRHGHGGDPPAEKARGKSPARHDKPHSDLPFGCVCLAKLQRDQSSTRNIVESHAPNERQISKSSPFARCVKVSAPIITVTLEALGMTTFSSAGS